MARPLVIPIVGDTRPLEKAALRAKTVIGQVGSTLTKTLTPAALAIGLAGKKAFEDWDAGLDAIRVGTGKTGAQLADLEATMKTVAGNVTEPLADVGQVVADLNTRLGITGEPLEQLSQQFLELSRITGTDASENIASITRLFGDWSVAAEDQAGTLDMLFRASQATGVSISELSRNMVQFGSPLRQLGVDMDFAAAMFANFEKAGVATSTLMPGLRFALKNLSGASPKLTKELKKLGVSLDDPQEALADVFKLLKDAPNNLKANQIAFKVFGQRAGPDMAAAVREGRFELDDLLKVMREGEDSVHAAAQDTLDLSDKLAMLKNRVVGALGPYGEFVAVVGAGLAAIGPTLLGLAAMGPVLSRLATGLKSTAAAQWLLNTAMLANPVVLVAAGLVALGIALVVAWKKSERFRKVVTGAWDKIKDATAAVFGFLRTFVVDAFDTIKQGFLRFTPLGIILSHWREIRDGARDRVNDIVGFFREMPGRIKDVFRTGWLKTMRTVNDLLDQARDFIGRVVDSIVQFFKDMPGRIVNALKGIGGKIKDAFSGIDISIPFSFNIPGIGDGIVPAGNPGGLSPSILDELALARAMGLGLMSGYRPGAITSTGNPSLHGIGKAIDVAGAPAAMAAFARLVAGRAGIREVIYTPVGAYYPGVGWVRPTGSVAADHYDHVHVGVADRGGIIRHGEMALNLSGRPERVLDPVETAAYGKGGGVHHHHHYHGPVVQDRAFIDYLRSVEKRYSRSNGGRPAFGVG